MQPMMPAEDGQALGKIQTTATGADRESVMTAGSQTTGTRRWEHTYPARPSEVRNARHDVGEFFSGCPRLDDLVLLISEIAANSTVHSKSNSGGKFTIRITAEEDYIFTECEDAGGLWRAREDDDRPHGLDIVYTLCGTEGWGVEEMDTGRVVWARLETGMP
jgi:anti-sigma regulatory factor (Ser/Thr protein kinase)